MDHARLNRARAIFDGALARDPGDREAFVLAECGTDAELAGMVLGILAHHCRSIGFDESSAGSPDSFGPGTRVGPYSIELFLGEGGFGVVYLAKQEKPLRRTVALKLIKPGMDSRAVLSRFDAERQALASMDHPGIAKVYDAGTTEQGRPYFVMQYIDGLPITAYCKQKELPIPERLALVARVCEAVQHAHQRGIIHRDIKPSNVLVTEQDGRPFPVVIDFGVAKAMDQRLGERTMISGEGVFIGTPEYMSPEQAGSHSGGVDTRSDIYSLGVLLYELLTGRLPYDLSKKLIHEAARIIQEEQPARLSTMSRTLGGDLETIALKALEKDKERRYAAASDLGGDISRYLRHEPIVARPASVGYQIRKFAQRNRPLVGAIAGAFVLLALGLAGTTFGLLRAEEQRREAVAAREAEAQQRNAAESSTRLARAETARAQAQLDRAERVAAFMDEMLRGVGPGVAQGRDTTVLKEIMDAAANRILGGELKDTPEAELSLRGTIGNTYRELALYDEASRMLEPAPRLARAIKEGDSMGLAVALGNLARLLQDRGELAEAEPLLREGLAMMRRVAPGDHRDVAGAINALGLLLQARGDLAGAEPLIRESLEMSRRLFPGDDPERAAAIGNLAGLLQDRGDPASAVPLFREALDMLRRLFPGDHPSVAAGLNNLALVLQVRGDLAEAESLFRESLDMVKRLLPPGDHPYLISLLGNLALVVQARGNLDGAEPLFREALQMGKRLFPGDHQTVALSLANLAVLATEKGDFDEAEALLREALAMYRRLFPGDHLQVAAALIGLADVLRERGDLVGAEPLYREALGMQHRLWPDGHPHLALGLTNLAGLLQTRGDLASAEPLFRESLEMYRRIFPGDNPEVATSLNNLAVVLQAENQFAEARASWDEAIAMLRRATPQGSPWFALVLWRSGSARLDNKDAAAALPELEEAVAMGEKALPAGDAQLKQYRDTLARCKAAMGM